MTVGVIGAGTMGAGIAQAALRPATRCCCTTRTPRPWSEHAAGSRRRSTGQLEKGRLSPEGRDDALGRLRPAAGLDQVAADADLVVEAVLEDLSLKRSIFRALDMNAHPEVPLATNTSSLSVAGSPRRRTIASACWDCTSSTRRR